MIDDIQDPDTDEFFEWLQARLPQRAKTAYVPRPPSQELLDAAWKAAQAHQKYLLDAGLYRQLIVPVAADEEGAYQKPVRFDDGYGHWRLTRETIPQDPRWEKLKFECRPGSIAAYRGHTVAVTIGGDRFLLGPVNRRGVATVKIPAGLDLRQTIEVSAPLS